MEALDPGDLGAVALDRFRLRGDLGRRVMRLDPGYRAQVIGFELQEGLGVSLVETTPDPAGGNGKASPAAPGLAAVVTVTERPLLHLERPDPAMLRAELPIVMGYTDLRLERSAEIIAQRSDVISYVGSCLPLDPLRTPRTIEFLLIAQTLTEGCMQSVKAVLGVPRPGEVHPAIQPMIATPSHGSYPSGHATQAFMCAAVLPALTGRIGKAHEKARQYMNKAAARVAQNRTVSGLHYPSDSAAGATLGRQLGTYLLARIRAGLDDEPGVLEGQELPSSRTLGATAWAAGRRSARDFTVVEFERFFEGLLVGDPVSVPAAPAAAALWRAARAEWED